MMLERIDRRRRLIMLAVVLVLAAVLGWAVVAQAAPVPPPCRPRYVQVSARWHVERWCLTASGRRVVCWTMIVPPGR